MNIAPSLRLLLLFAMAAQAPALASACGNGADRILFTEAPPAKLPGAETIRVHFTNIGPRFDEWRKRPPAGQWPGHLIGVARVLGAQDAKRDDYFPVYASVSSCTGAFWSMVVGAKEYRVWDAEYYLVGRFLSHTPGFRAGGEENGRWHY